MSICYNLIICIGIMTKGKTNIVLHDVMKNYNTLMDEENE